eukprot:10571260-Karenia_brevis.AAC.1
MAVDSQSVAPQPNQCECPDPKPVAQDDCRPQECRLSQSNECVLSDDDDDDADDDDDDGDGDGD